MAEWFPPPDTPRRVSDPTRKIDDVRADVAAANAVLRDPKTAFAGRPKEMALSDWADMMRPAPTQSPDLPRRAAPTMLEAFEDVDFSRIESGIPGEDPNVPKLTNLSRQRYTDVIPVARMAEIPIAYPMGLPIYDVKEWKSNARFGIPVADLLPKRELKRNKDGNYSDDMSGEIFTADEVAAMDPSTFTFMGDELQEGAKEKKDGPLYESYAPEETKKPKRSRGGREKEEALTPEIVPVAKPVPVARPKELPESPAPSRRSRRAASQEAEGVPSSPEEMEPSGAPTVADRGRRPSGKKDDEKDEDDKDYKYKFRVMGVSSHGGTDFAPSLRELFQETGSLLFDEKKDEDRAHRKPKDMPSESIGSRGIAGSASESLGGMSKGGGDDKLRTAIEKLTTVIEKLITTIENGDGSNGKGNKMQVGPNPQATHDLFASAASMSGSSMVDRQNGGVGVVNGHLGPGGASSGVGMTRGNTQLSRTGAQTKTKQ